MSATVTSFSVNSSLFFVHDEQGSRPASREDVLLAAQGILQGYVRKSSVMDAPRVAQDYFAARLGHLDREVFAAMFLDSHFRLIECQDMFPGTVDACTVYPRAVVRQCVLLNSSSVVLARNDTSGHPEARDADLKVAQTLRAALRMIDVRVLDYLVVGGARCTSLAEKGLI